MDLGKTFRMLSVALLLFAVNLQLGMNSDSTGLAQILPQLPESFVCSINEDDETSFGTFTFGDLVTKFAIQGESAFSFTNSNDPGIRTTQILGTTIVATPFDQDPDATSSEESVVFSLDPTEPTVGILDIRSGQIAVSFNLLILPLEDSEVSTVSIPVELDAQTEYEAGFLNAITGTITGVLPTEQRVTVGGATLELNMRCISDRYTIFLKSRTFTPMPGITASSRSKILASELDRLHVIMQFFELPSVENRNELAALEVNILDPIPNHAFFASVQPDLIDDVMLLNSVRMITDILPEDRVDPAILTLGVPGHAQNANGTVNLRVLFFEDVPFAEAIQLISGFEQSQILEELPQLHMLSIAVDPSVLLALADEDIVMFIESVPPPPQDDNDGARQAVSVDLAQQAPHNLDGTGVLIGEWDGGHADNSHPDLIDRVTFGDSAGISDHATHIAGTVLGRGVLSGGDLRGMAPNARLISFSTWENTSELIDEYTTGLTTGTGIDLSTNSWGTSHCHQEACYNSDSRSYDRLVKGELLANLPIPISVVASAGNCGPGASNVGRCETTNGSGTWPNWGTVRIPNSAKNTIVVGATDDSGVITGFSSRGPTTDGRIKPDIAAPGSSLRSTIPNNHYTDDSGLDCDGTGDDFCFPYDRMSGTSMSTPVVAGSLALLLQEWRKSRDVSNPFPSTLKAVVIHTADDRGLNGPDFTYGFGLIDVRTAAEVIGNIFDHAIIERTLYNTNDIDSYSMLVAPGTAQISITLAWDDTPGTANAAVALENDLDLLLVDPNGNLHYPWTHLTPVAAPNLAAVRAPDHRNNVEKAQVDLPIPGIWEVRVIGFAIPEPVQRYSLIYPTAMLHIAKSLTSPSVAALEDTVTFNIKITNTSPASITELPLDDIFDSRYLEFTSAGIQPGAIVADLIQWSDLTAAAPHGFDQNLAQGESFDLDLAFRVIACPPPGSNILTNKTKIQDAVAIINGRHHVIPQFSATDQVRIVCLPEITITKELIMPETGPAHIGDLIEFKITIANTGDTTITELPLVDTFDASCMTLFHRSLASNSYHESGSVGMIQWDDLTQHGLLGFGEDLAIGESFTLFTKFRATAETLSCLNTAEVKDTNTATDDYPMPNTIGAIDEFDQPVPDVSDSASVRIIR